MSNITAICENADSEYVIVVKYILKVIMKTWSLALTSDFENFWVD